MAAFDAAKRQIVEELRQALSDYCLVNSHNHHGAIASDFLSKVEKDILKLTPQPIERPNYENKYSRL